MSQNETAPRGGKRAAGGAGGGAKVAVGALAALVLLGAGGYLGLCAYASGSDTIYPGVRANGVDLGGMTEAQAEAYIRQEAKVDEGTVVDLTVSLPDGETITRALSYDDLGGATLDAGKAASAAFAACREGGFLGLKSYLDLAPAYIPRKEIRIFDFFPKYQLEPLIGRK